MLYNNTKEHGEPIYAQFWIGCFDQHGHLVGHADSRSQHAWDDVFTGLVELRPGVLFGLTTHWNGEVDALTFSAPRLAMVAQVKDSFDGSDGLSGGGRYVFASSDAGVLAIATASAERIKLRLERRLIQEVDPETERPTSKLVPEPLLIVIGSGDGKTLLVNQGDGFLVYRVTWR